MPSKTIDDRYWLAGGRKTIPTVTRAALAFTTEHSRLLDFAVFSKTAFLDRMALEAATGGSGRTDGFSLLEMENQHMLEELVLTRTVDNFLCFISELLALIYEAKPEMLHSSEQERIDFVLKFSDMNQLRAAIAEKRVERLSYLGLKELAGYIETQMSFQLFEDASELEAAAMLVEMRNICVHARGRIGATSVKRFPQLRAHIGNKLDLTLEKVTSNRRFLEHCVFDIDVRAAAKFSLPSMPLRDPPEDILTPIGSL